MARRPALPLLSFHATRLRLAGLLRAHDPQVAAGLGRLDSPAIVGLAEAGTAGMIPADRAIVGLDLLDRLVAALQGPAATTRRVAAGQRTQAAAAQNRRSIRDIAMLHVAYDLLLRASELVNMQWARLERSARGSGTYRFGKTKTDQVGLGRTLYVRPETMGALDA